MRRKIDRLFLIKVNSMIELDRKTEDTFDNLKYLFFFNDKFKTHTIVINPECFCSDCTKCTCYFFLDKAICYHIVACCLLDDINYLGLKDKQFGQ
ncbi:hypothetical protein BpHYR1_005601 [Brachionus plicatilis]|uniref:SWIM-type domain-containing protein n=1 Tax=Brachionus plicatilis TaxID=10195 RepID=A0A3M7QVR0_BRAPC|nr:hypothetical protein BpHYR1_005601 [Brachionus plicatilis]